MASSTRLAAPRLIAITGVACLLAVVLPSTRETGLVRWWWQQDPASGLAGVTALLATIVLLLATFVARPRGLGVIGSLLALGSAAMWALVTPSSAGAVILVIATLALIGCAIEVATPSPRPLPSTTRLGWTLGASVATIALAVLALLGLTIGRVSPLVSIAAGAAGVVALFSTLHANRARSRPPVLAAIAIALALAAALGFVVAPVLQGDRSGAVASARVVMLLVTATASLAALLVGFADAPHRPTPTSSFPGVSP